MTSPRKWKRNVAIVATVVGIVLVGFALFLWESRDQIISTKDLVSRDSIGKIERIVSIPFKNVVGQPIPLRIAITNLGPKDFRWDHRKIRPWDREIYTPYWVIVVYYSQGRYVNHTVLGAEILNSEIAMLEGSQVHGSVNLEPGESYTYEFDLNELCTFRQGGTYSVMVRDMVLRFAAQGVDEVSFPAVSNKFKIH